jgi:hypothetical protein
VSFQKLAPALSLLAQVPFPWGFAGGWAVDLFSGQVRRTHGDIDIAILRQDQTTLFRHFPNWRWQVIRRGQASDWTGTWVDAPIHEIRACGPDGAQLEFLLNETDGPLWRFRRDARVTALVASIFVRAGIYPALAPEIVLLYKAKLMQAKDIDDFAVAAPLLPANARQWLRDALTLAHPGHTWIAALG